MSLMDEASDTGSTKTNVDNMINLAQQQRCMADRWPFMEWQKPVTFPLVSGQQYYSLHQAFGRPKYFFNQTKKVFLQEVPPRAMATPLTDWNADTSGLGFVIQGFSPVQTQPSAASTVSIVSSSASDASASKNVIVRGDTTNGIASATLTPNGTSTITSATSFSRILDVSLAGVWLGTLTLKAGSTTLLTLLAGEYGRQYPQMRLLYLPTGGDTIEYDFYQIPRVLVNDYDVPQIPFPFSQILVYDALLLMAAYDNQTDPGRVQIWMQMRDQLIIQMRQAFLEGQSLNARVRYVREINDGQEFV